jgi:hypothetical protein
LSNPWGQLAAILNMSLRGGLLLFPTKQSPYYQETASAKTRTPRSDMPIMRIAETVGFAVAIDFVDIP